MVRTRLLLLLTVGACVLAPATARAAGSRDAPSGPGAPGVSVQGNQLLRNGVPWIPRGVQIVGLVAPDAALSGKYIPAHTHFGAAELQAAVAQHADLVRFQVSEFGLDPQGPLYSPAYVQEVRDGVQAARALGLAVIISLQAEPPAGEPTRCPLPDGGAERAWEEIAPLFAGDSGVMFELYNEPAIAPTGADWQLWRDGGEVLYPNGSCAAVGMQTLVDEIRTVAPSNVIVIPGLAGEQTLAGLPGLTDPADPSDPQLAYGIHYPSLTKGLSTWERAFGRISGRVPVIVSEWQANATTNCVANAPVVAPLLLDYLASKRIGVVGFAFDLPGTIVADWSYAPTTYTDFACGDPAGGVGQLLFADYAAEAQAGDGTQPDPAPGWLISAADLTRLHTTAPDVTAHLFNTPRTFVTGTSPATLAALGMPTALRAATFTNAASLIGAVNTGRLPAGTSAVIYAAAHARSTPLGQQRHPARYYRLAGQAAHAHGLLFIAAPAVSLVAALEPRTPAAAWDAQFIRLRIAAQAAAYADVYQAQVRMPPSPPDAYAALLGLQAAQAQTAHPGIELLAGLSAGPPRHRTPAGRLLNGYLGTRRIVSGYGFSDPAAPDTTACAGCARLAPDPGPGFLRRLARLDG